MTAQNKATQMLMQMSRNPITHTLRGGGGEGKMTQPLWERVEGTCLQHWTRASPMTQPVDSRAFIPETRKLFFTLNMTTVHCRCIREGQQLRTPHYVPHKCMVTKLWRSVPFPPWRSGICGISRARGCGFHPWPGAMGRGSGTAAAAA